jgi:PAS domain S-box-containing protein
MKKLDTSNFEKLFPFYLEINEELIILSIGPSLNKICHNIVGEHISSVFDFVRPKMSIKFTFESFLQQLDLVIILESKKSKIRFRGQFIFEKSTQTIFYINSPWLTEINDLENNNLLISDFALHDTVTDNLQLLRSKEITNKDLIKLNEELIENEKKIVLNNENLKVAEEKYKMLVESSTDIIFRVNSEGNYIYVNPNASKITGYSENEILGQNYTFLLDDKHKIKLRNFYAFQLEQNIENTKIEFPILTKEGIQIWLEQSVTLVKTDEGVFEWVALARDVTEKKMAQNYLIRSEEKYKSILENLELGLVEADENNIIVRAYPKFCELVGYEEHEVIGENAIDLLLDDEAKIIMRQQEAKRQEGKPSVYELQLTKKSGEKVWVMISGAPFYDLNDKFLGTIGIHLDISERKKMEEDLKQAKEIAESSLKSKEMFLANISHEIRTPLNAIIGMGEIVMQTDLSIVQQQYLQAISTASEHLLELINDILNFSKIDAGKIELEHIPIDLNKILTHTADLLSFKADQNNVLIQINSDNKANTFHLSDPTRLSEIVTNLMSNAVKFSKDSIVTVNYKISELNDRTDLLYFEIIDKGIGIPENKLGSIFDEFTQANESITRNYGGTGLGLSITKKLVNLFGGELEVESTLGVGSRFYFTIRLEKSNVGISAKKDSSLVNANLIAGLKVLVADDNQMNLFLVKALLEKWQAECHTANNGAEVIEILQEQKFDLILMDIRMPILDGLDASWMIRNKLHLTVPIVALTANAEPNELNKYSEYGIDDYLCKPFKQNELIHVLSKLFPDRKPLKVSESLLDLKTLHESFDNDEEVINQLLDLFKENLPLFISQISQAIKNKDSVYLKSLAHKIKPSLEFLAKKEVARLAIQLERETLSEQNFWMEAKRFLDYLLCILDELKV